MNADLQMLYTRGVRSVARDVRFLCHAEEILAKLRLLNFGEVLISERKKRSSLTNLENFGKVTAVKTLISKKNFFTVGELS